jgi:hypothetical protein
MTSPDLEAQVNKWLDAPGKYYADFDKQGDLKIGSLGIFTGRKKVKLENSSWIIATTLSDKNLYFDRLITKFEQELIEKRENGKVIAGLGSIIQYVKDGRLQLIRENIQNREFEAAYNIFKKLTGELKAEFMHPTHELYKLIEGTLGKNLKPQDVEVLARFFIEETPVKDKTTGKMLPPTLSRVLRAPLSSLQKMQFLLPFYENNPTGIYSVVMVQCLKELLNDKKYMREQGTETVSLRATILERVASKNLHVLELLLPELSDKIKQVIIESKNRSETSPFWQKLASEAFDKKYVNVYSLLLKLHAGGKDEAALCDEITKNYLMECIKLEPRIVNRENSKHYQELPEEWPVKIRLLPTWIPAMLRAYVKGRCDYYNRYQPWSMGEADLQKNIYTPIEKLETAGKIIEFFRQKLKEFKKPAANASAPPKKLPPNSGLKNSHR